MAGSSNDKINYNLRPSKSIERKMILEVLKEICPPSESSNYQYIGLGSAFFVDFKLVHKILGINKMYSFEGKKSNVERCIYNKPYKCINIIPERTNKELINLEWGNKKSIVWLDFEDELKKWMLDDLETITQNSKQGNIFVITLRRSFNKISLDEFNDIYGDLINDKATENDVHEKNSAEILRQIFINKISDKLIKSFSAFPEGEKIQFQQLFDFTYEDGAAMYTFGGIFLENSKKELFENAKFYNLDFVKAENQPYNITCPVITDKEFHLLNQQLPSNDIKDYSETEDLRIVPKKHRENYFRTYKYYPNYFELWV